MEQRDKMLTASDIAKYLNVSEHTVYRWCKSGRIPHFNLDSTYRFDPGEITSWLKSKHKAHRPPVPKTVTEAKTGTEA